MFNRKPQPDDAAPPTQASAASVSRIGVSAKATTAAEREAVAQSVNFETSLLALTRRSERRAWWVAGSAVCSTLLLGASYIFVMPLKEREPFLVVTDPYTSSATLVRVRDGAGTQEFSQTEVLNKSLVARYLTARESYDWDLVGRRDWELVHAMGTAPVNTLYAAQFKPENPFNPDRLYGRDKTARVRIKSIVLGSRAQGGFESATVRFDRVVLSRSAGRIESADAFIATLAFQFAPGLQMPENHLIENPLGFQVTAYRVDPDFADDPALRIREAARALSRVGGVVN